jgi:hypothetical protein
LEKWEEGSNELVPQLARRCKELDEKLETLLVAAKKSLKYPCEDKPHIELWRALEEVVPDYFITAEEWLKNPTFDQIESD